ncbi:MAG: SH3 domain-containing protein [Anaerolineae bacterium]|nr:SH3 domain-containing protein [Anaerolineae bacterium]
MRRRFFHVLKNLSNVWRDERGTVSIEMALVTLILSAVLFGGVEIMRYGLLRYHLDRATYHAARYLVLNPNATDAARAMVRAEVEHNVLGNADNVQLYAKSARREGRCLLIVETRVRYEIEELNWLLVDPSAESVQVWPQPSGCRELAARPQLPTRTLTPTPTSIPTLAQRVRLDLIEGVAMVNANIRLGPGFEYAIVGRLAEKEVVQVRGRDETATWLQVLPERIGWVYAPLIQIDEPVSSLQIVAAPPLPLRTPAPPARLLLDAVPKVLKVGECAWLRWDTADADFVTLNEKDVALQGEQKVCPTVDTKYVLSASYDQDRFFDREVKIMIYPAGDP